MKINQSFIGVVVKAFSDTCIKHCKLNIVQRGCIQFIKAYIHTEHTSIRAHAQVRAFRCLWPCTYLIRKLIAKNDPVVRLYVKFRLIRGLPQVRNRGHFIMPRHNKMLLHMADFNAPFRLNILLNFCTANMEKIVNDICGRTTSNAGKIIFH